MKIRIVPFVLVILALAGVAPVFAQQVVVGYVEGVLEVRDGSSWAELFIGDSVDQDDRVRLSDNSYAELSNGRTTVKLTREGTYLISDLIEGSSRTESAGVAGLVLNRIGRLTGREDEEEQTSAGGARASEAVTQTGPTWAGGESIDELITEGSELLADGAYEDAYFVLQEAYDYAITDEEFARTAFYYGYAAALTGRTREALGLLEDVGPDPESDFFASHVLALGQLLVETFAYQDAIDYLSLLADADDQADEDVQSAELLIGIAYDGLGMPREAERYLRRATRTVPGTPAATAAQRLLAGL